MTARDETTKIVNKECQDCGNVVSILVNASAMIVAVRCPKCFKKFQDQYRER